MYDILNAELSQIHNIKYPEPPFNPPEIFPEFKSNNSFEFHLDKQNEIYYAIRDLFTKLGFDKLNFNKITWNPLKHLVNQGDKIVIKPNLVIHKHPLGIKGVECMITHASIIRPVIDYLLLATNKKCTITICDVPLQNADWNEIIELNGLKSLVEFYFKNHIKINLLDLRYEIAFTNKEGVIYKKEKKKLDPSGYQVVDLKDKSYIAEIIENYKKLEITDYNIGTVSKHHFPGKNEYLICNTILNSDLFINIPKLKTHRKAGVTLSLKNIIGINGDKSWIAHHCRGLDEYKKFHFMEYFKWYISYYFKNYAPVFITTLLYKLHRIIFLKGMDLKTHGMLRGGPTMEGNWYGNDTIWRTILDLNNIIFFSDKQGNMKSEKQRKYFTIIDGIIGMENEGPMDGNPKKCGIILGGNHPVVLDCIGSWIMGFNFEKIPSLKKAFEKKFFNLIDIDKRIIINLIEKKFDKINFHFNPSKGWKEYIER
jgi:uncharacterized protein (DUF362 family)